MSKSLDLKKVSKELEKNLQIDVNELYSAFIGRTNIEKYKEETNVLRMLMEGKKKKEILGYLRKKHPQGTFTPRDLEKFMYRNNEIVSHLVKENKLTAKRHLHSRSQVSELLASAVMFTTKMAKEFYEQGDNTNAISAIKALNQTLRNYVEFENMIENPEKNTQQINILNVMAEDVISKLKHNAHYANFEDDDGKV